MDRTDSQGSVLVTGGSGLVGRYLTSALLAAGYKVSHLSRKTNQFGKVRVYRWDPGKGILDPVNLEGIDYVIHLAGAGIGEKRWTLQRKAEITRSRIDSTKLLYRTLSENNITLRAFISASATGYYGSAGSDRIFTEEDPPAGDFLGETCRLWEEAADMFREAGTRVVKIRTGVVLDKNGGMLARMLKPARLGIFPVFGSGKQYMPWIHIEDLRDIYLKVLSDETFEGSFNAVAPEYATQEMFMRLLAATMKRSYFHPRVPASLLRLTLGELSDIVLTGSRISARRITGMGYMFRYPYLKDALIALLG